MGLAWVGARPMQMHTRDLRVGLPGTRAPLFIVHGVPLFIFNMSSFEPPLTHTHTHTTTHTTTHTHTHHQQGNNNNLPAGDPRVLHWWPVCVLLLMGPGMYTAQCVRM